MVKVPADILQQLRKTGQEHVLDWWDQLPEGERRELVDQLKGIHFDQLRSLFNQREWAVSLPASEKIQPVPVIRTGTPEARQIGEEALRNGEVAVLMVAGGQGSRLGFEKPKGMYPIGLVSNASLFRIHAEKVLAVSRRYARPVPLFLMTSPAKNKSLFQIHAEKVLALGRRYGRPLPFLVMTSPATHGETESFFLQYDCFGLRREDVFLFCQGTLPALDMATGKLLLEKRGRIFTSPNGHGGVLAALADSGLLGWLRRQNVKNIFYFQVDNPLVNIADPIFLGHHLAAEAEVSSKIVRKEGPKDKLGNVVLIDSCRSSELVMFRSIASR